MSDDFDATLTRVLSAIRRRDASTAIAQLQRVFEFPAVPSDASRFRAALSALGETLASYESPNTARVRAAASASDDPAALFDAAYGLIDEGYAGFAATVLQRAHALNPNDEKTLSELATALEVAGDYASAALTLEERPPALADSFLLRYLHAFLSALAGDLEPALRESEPLQAAAGDDAQRFMAERLAGVAARARTLRGTLPLGADDTRGWHALLFGGLLLNKVAGDPRGRAQKLSDDWSGCRSAIERLKLHLAALDLQPDRVWVLTADPSSAALALATARRLGLEAVPWPAEGSDRPGLIPVYDLKAIPTDLENGYRNHQPRQILWDRAARWTIGYRFTADLTDTFCTDVVAPWGKVRIGDESATPEAWADRIERADLGEVALAPDVVAAARALQPLGERGAGVWRRVGPRVKRWPWAVL